MSDWIPSQAGLRSNPKTRRAARALGMEPEPFIGHLHCLWWWALEYAPDGDLEDFEPEDIADGAGWRGDAEQFVAALLGAGARAKPGFLDRDGDGRLAIHDWEENQGPQFRARIKAAARKRAERARKCDAGVTDQENVTTSCDGVTVACDLARAKDRPTDRQDRPTSAPAQESPVDNLVGLATTELPPSGSTTEDYQRTIDRYRPKLTEEHIERIICGLGSKPKYHDPKKKLHLTLAAWLSKEPRDPVPPSHAAWQQPRAPDPHETGVPMPDYVRQAISGIGKAI